MNESTDRCKSSVPESFVPVDIHPGRFRLPALPLYRAAHDVSMKHAIVPPSFPSHSPRLGRSAHLAAFSMSLAHQRQHRSAAWTFHLTIRHQPDATATLQQTESYIFDKHLIHGAQGIVLIQLPNFRLANFGGPGDLFHRETSLFDLTLVSARLVTVLHYELFTSVFGICGMIQSINARGERVCM